MAWNSGGSRKRPVSMTLAEMKLPNLAVPAARLAAKLEDPKEPYEALTSPVGLLVPSPDRVVATMTSEVLPPYSAGGAPGMTSRDWTESIGIWLEKVLLV